MCGSAAGKHFCESLAKILLIACSLRRGPLALWQVERPPNAAPDQPATRIGPGHRPPLRYS